MKWKEKIDFDQTLFSLGDWLIGIDEVGWGSFAGSIVLGCVAIHRSFYEDLLDKVSKNSILQKVDDSKKISERNRKSVSEAIQSLVCDRFLISIGEAEPELINSKGMVAAYKFAFESALSKILKSSDSIQHDFYKIILDGSRKVQNTIYEHETIIKGDAQSYILGCASTVAKVYRDSLILEQSSVYPYYKWDKNKGYGTEDHREAIKKYGSCPLHRTLFIK